MEENKTIASAVSQRIAINAASSAGAEGFG